MSVGCAGHYLMLEDKIRVRVAGHISAETNGRGGKAVQEGASTTFTTSTTTTAARTDGGRWTTRAGRQGLFLYRCLIDIDVRCVAGGGG